MENFAICRFLRFVDRTIITDSNAKTLTIPPPPCHVCLPHHSKMTSCREDSSPKLNYTAESGEQNPDSAELSCVITMYLKSGKEGYLHDMFE